MIRDITRWIVEAILWALAVGIGVVVVLHGLVWLLHQGEQWLRAL